MNKHQVPFARLQKTKRTLCFLFIIFSSSFGLFAQTIAFTTGTSFPYGLYASKDFNQTSAGMAINGQAYSLLLEDNRKARTVSPFVQFTHNTNQIDQNALNDVYKYIGVNAGYRGAQAFKPWAQTLLLGGARFSYFGENYELFAKTGIGMGWLSTYGYNIYSDTLGFIKFNPLKVNTLSLLGGFGMYLYGKKNISVTLGYDFFYANADYGYEKFTTGGNPIRASVAVKVKPPLQLGNFYLGFRLNLNRQEKK
jgi:hypothetical protein